MVIEQERKCSDSIDLFVVDNISQRVEHTGSASFTKVPLKRVSERFFVRIPFQEIGTAGNFELIFLRIG